MSTSTSSLLTSKEPAQQRTQHWLNIVSHLDPRYGGISAAVPKLASTVAASPEFQMSLAAFCAADESWSAKAFPDLSVSKWPLSRLAWLKDRSLSSQFNELAKTMDGIHIHGLWEQSSQAAAKAARTHKLPYLISAHGMLEPWALNNKRLKKQIYSALIERSNISNATCLHALTQAEAEDYRRYCMAHSIVVIPNGVEIPNNLDSKFFLSRYPHLEGKRIVLFLGRIHFKKGLDILVKAWHQIAAHHPDAHLVLAGPDSEDSRHSIAQMIQDLSLTGSVTFTGMLLDDLKWSALAAAHGFVLPSYSEGLSISALEAMGAGLPVILSDRCHLPEIAQCDAGWVIPANTESLRNVLEEFFENAPSSTREIGMRGRALVRERYTWSRVASQMSEIYNWLTGGNLPTSVEVQRGGRN